MPRFEIRPVRLDDLESLLELMAEHAEFEQASFDPEGKVARLRALLFAPSPRLRASVAVRDGALVGYLTWSCEVSTWEASEFVHIDCLYMRPEARGTGLAIALIHQLAVDGRALGKDKATAQWQTPPFNKRAIKLYEAFGAQRKDKVRFYFPPDLIDRLAGRAEAEGRTSWYVQPPSTPLEANNPAEPPGARGTAGLRTTA